MSDQNIELSFCRNYRQLSLHQDVMEIREQDLKVEENTKNRGQKKKKKKKNLKGRFWHCFFKRLKKKLLCFLPWFPFFIYLSCFFAFIIVFHITPLKRFRG